MLANIFLVVISIPENFIPLPNTHRRRDIHTGDTSFKNVVIINVKKPYDYSTFCRFLYHDS